MISSLRSSWLFAACAALIAATTVCHAQQAATAPAAESATAAKLSLASIFSDHMVLQRDMKLPIWGKAAPGVKVAVQLAGKTQEATADADGKWRLSVGPLKASKDPLELNVTAGDQSLHHTDILVGDVWVASGQSNMEWYVDRSDNPEKEIAAANWPEIRIIDVPNVTADAPAESFETAGWKPVTPETIPQFSAVAYFFGRELHEHLDVPIGLIGCNWGGTPMEAWTSREALESSPTFKNETAASFTQPSTTQEAEDRKARAHHSPARLYNGMLAAVIPYGIRGAIWYQGESNAGRHQQYAELSKLMITDWRNHWDQGEFPFLLVQLAAFEPGGETWPPLREAQQETLELPNTGMAVAIDIGHQTDIHPKDKQTVGKRLALAARAIAHGEKIVHSGPIYREMKAADGKATLSFDSVGGGLKAEGDLRGFEIAGADGKFVPAKATIEGEHVVVSSEAVAEPKTVRYNWSAFPDGNLYNAEGLPAVPFRTSKQEAPAEPAKPAVAATPNGK
jgi:sialate O-acetylesterase